jgi:hypothetical protein
MENLQSDKARGGIVRNAARHVVMQGADHLRKNPQEEDKMLMQQRL